MKSLRSLIRQSSLILMAALLLVFSILTYAGGDALLRRFVDGRLFGLAETMAKILEQHPNIIESSSKESALAAEVIPDKNEEREVTHSLRIFSTDGRLVWKSPNAVAQGPIPNHVFEQVRRGNTLYETAESLLDAKSVRQLYVPIPRQGQVRYVLQAEASLLLYRETLIGLVILLTLGSGTILFVAWMGSGWLAKKILTPIEVLSTGAETMSEADLGKRLTLDSPYQEFRRLTQAFNSVMDRFQRSGEIQRRFCD
ncbi:MAG: HAMP domain-containing protein, partial [Nitrospirota bacterium]